MAMANDSTTLLCLFHHEGQARAALDDLYQAGIPRDSITTVDTGDLERGGGSPLREFGVPERDLDHLERSVRDGGSIVIVSAIADHVGTVERIFGKHRATKIDEAVTREQEPVVAPLAAASAVGETTIPIVDEELAVGKRTVDRGGVHVYRRVIEVPVEESVQLRDERVVVERSAVDRPATAGELDGQGSRSIELTETAEEAVVAKTAHVVEEVHIGKQTEEHTEHIQDTVRRTEVEVEALAPTEAGNAGSLKRSNS